MGWLSEVGELLLLRIVTPWRMLGMDVQCEELSQQIVSCELIGVVLNYLLIVLRGPRRFGACWSNSSQLDLSVAAVLPRVDPVKSSISFRFW